MDKRPMELSDTVPMMTSTDYKERFRAEYCQAGIRLQKLTAMLHDWDEGNLSFTLTCPRSTLELQVRVMKDYLTVLEARAVMEGIKLED